MSGVSPNASGVAPNSGRRRRRGAHWSGSGPRRTPDSHGATAVSHHAARPTNRLAARPDQRDALAALLFLLIGGRVLAGQYVIQFCGAEVKLTHAAFSALLDLVRALLTTETGLSPLPSVASGKGGVHQTVRRLRAAIDAALGAGTGARFVQSCGRGTYRLAIP